MKKTIILISSIILLFSFCRADNLFKISAGCGMNLSHDKSFNEYYRNITFAPYGKLTLKLNFLGIGFLKNIGLYTDCLYVKNKSEIDISLDNNVNFKDTINCERIYTSFGVEKRLDFRSLSIIPNVAYTLLRLKETALGDSNVKYENYFKLSCIFNKWLSSKKKLAFFIDVNYLFAFDTENLGGFNLIGGVSFYFNPFRSKFL